MKKLLCLFIPYIIFSQNYNNWSEINSLKRPRIEHAFEVLPDGNVLVSGGGGADTVNNSCEIYNIDNNEWNYTTPMNVARSNHDMMLLNNGKVLAIGGFRETSCEIFDYESKTWTMTDSLLIERFYGQRVVKLKNGKILICGGMYSDDSTGVSVFLNNCEIYDYLSEKWTQVSPMIEKRTEHTCTLLKSGKVLVTGGYNNNFTLASCEIYDPDTDVWTKTGELLEKRTNHSAINLGNGLVFVSGGSDLGNNTHPWKNSCETYDYLTEKWTQIPPMIEERENHSTFTTYDQNKIIIVGGIVGGGTVFEKSELYDVELMFPSEEYTFPQMIILEKNILQLSNMDIMVIGGYEVSLSDDLPMAKESKKCFKFDLLTDIKTEKRINNFNLFQNYPNPFNPSTQISYQIPENEFVSLKVYNSLGEEVRTLVNNYQSSGYYNIEFDGTELSSGIYFYKLHAGKYVSVRKMLITK
ncbi:MAG: T9SS type A sorting domain-containing protein [Ignavibacteriales bacterium]|nr:T9SS type A sorting domain-containing protein [Ignavibacteriales bacterium]